MFRFCNSVEEIKKLYRKLSFKLHPDMGGEPELFSILQKSYEMALDDLKNKKNAKPSNFSAKYEFTSCEIHAGDPRLDIFAEIFEYADKHKKFDSKFTDSVIEYLGENGCVTSQQYNSLVRIYYGFKMHIKKEESEKGK